MLPVTLDTEKKKTTADHAARAVTSCITTGLAGHRPLDPLRHSC